MCSYASTTLLDIETIEFHLGVGGGTGTEYDEYMIESKSNSSFQKTHSNELKVAANHQLSIATVSTMMSTTHLYLGLINNNGAIYLLDYYTVLNYLHFQCTHRNANQRNTGMKSIFTDELWYGRVVVLCTQQTPSMHLIIQNVSVARN